MTTIVPIKEQTVYTRLGDWFGWLCVVGIAILMATRARQLASNSGT